jgi:glutaredoxin 3
MDNVQAKPQKKITIYTTPSCHWCKTSKEYFKENNLQWEEHDVTKDLAAREEMVKKSGQLGVPVIDIGGDIVVGFDKERIDELLELSGN